MMHPSMSRSTWGLPLLGMALAVAVVLPTASVARPKAGPAGPVTSVPAPAPPKAPEPPKSAPRAPTATPPGGATRTPAESSSPSRAIDERPTFGPRSMGAGMGGPANLRTPAGTDRPVPAETARLWVKEEIAETELIQGKPVSVRWDVTRVPDATGVGLLVSDRTLDAESCAGLSPGTLRTLGLPGSGIHPGATGSTLIDPGGVSRAARVQLVACPLRGLALDEVIDSPSNVVRARVLAGAPDLVVSRLELVKGELRFRVLNAGRFPKDPGDLKYTLIHRREDRSPRRQVHYGTAGVAGLSRLQPGMESGENRVVGSDVDLSGGGDTELCVNSSRSVVETNYENNCRSLHGAELLPDLAVVDVSLVLLRHDECHWYQGARCFLGPEDDRIVATVRNRSAVVRAANTRVRARIFAGTKLVFEEVVPINPLEPGESQDVEFVVLDGDASRSFAQVLFEDHNLGSCCTASAMVDPAGRIPEADETNNERSVEVIPPR